MVKVAEGTWDNNTAEKIANFEAVETDTIQLKILQGVEGYASAAEINLLKPLATSDEPATPPAPKPDPKPETPAPKDDGTVELEDTFVAKNQQTQVQSNLLWEAKTISKTIQGIPDSS